MAFDVNNPANLAALKAEVMTDPLGFGYDPGNTTQTLKSLNDRDGNLSGATSNIRLTVGALMTQMVPDDLDAQQVGDGERRYIEMLTTGRDFSTDIEEWRGQVVSAFKANSQTVTNINAMTRLVSRAEELFGLGTVISRNDWIAARDS